MSTINLTFVRPSKRTDVFVHRLVEDTGDLIVSDFTFEMSKPFMVNGRSAVVHGDRGLLFEYSDGYEIIAVAHGSKLVGHYLNINLPFERTKDGYMVRDLFLDIWIWKDGNYVILDEDEYAEACENGWISKDEQGFASRIMKRLVAMITSGDFPPEKVSSLSKKWLKTLKGSRSSGG